MEQDESQRQEFVFPIISTELCQIYSCWILSNNTSYTFIYIVKIIIIDIFVIVCNLNTFIYDILFGKIITTIDGM